MRFPRIPVDPWQYARATPRARQLDTRVRSRIPYHTDDPTRGAGMDACVRARGRAPYHIPPSLIPIASSRSRGVWRGKIRRARNWVLSVSTVRFANPEQGTATARHATNRVRNPGRTVRRYSSTTVVFAPPRGPLPSSSQCDVSSRLHSSVYRKKTSTFSFSGRSHCRRSSVVAAFPEWDGNGSSWTPHSFPINGP